MSTNYYGKAGSNNAYTDLAQIFRLNSSSFVSNIKTYYGINLEPLDTNATTVNSLCNNSNYKINGFDISTLATMNYVDYTSSTTVIVPTNCYSIYAMVVGGGGGGGQSGGNNQDAQQYSGYSGGGGGFAAGSISVPDNYLITVTVGGGGGTNGTNRSNASGSSGGPSGVRYSNSALYAYGGGGGGGGARQSVSGNFTSPGVGGITYNTTYGAFLNQNGQFTNVIQNDGQSQSNSPNYSGSIAWYPNLIYSGYYNISNFQATNSVVSNIHTAWSSNFYGCGGQGGIRDTAGYSDTLATSGNPGIVRIYYIYL